MPYLPTSDAWLAQSALLLKAYPNSTRVTTKYTLPNPSSKSAKPTPPTTDTTQTPAGPQAHLTLKTYDPHSGTTLKYRTDKAFEVGRLITALHKLSRAQAGLPELTEDVIMGEDAPVEETKVVSGAATPAAPAPTAGGGGGGGGGKKKKKGKK